VAAIREWPEVATLKQLQEFLGFMNFLRPHCGPHFNAAMNDLRPYLKPGATFPLTAEAQRSVEGLKRLAVEQHTLFVFDEDGARSGERPAEQIVDVSGTAIGGVLVQMAEDLSRFKPLHYYSESLAPTQFHWHPFKQELYGQKRAKTVFRREIGRSPDVAWTDHANLCRLATMPLERVEPLIFRWFAELTGDGTKLLPLAGRSQILVAADALSRNHPDRDLLLGARSEDLNALKRQIREFDVSAFVEGDKDPVPSDVIAIRSLAGVASEGGGGAPTLGLFLPGYEHLTSLAKKAQRLAERCPKASV